MTSLKVYLSVPILYTADGMVLLVIKHNVHRNTDTDSGMVTVHEWLRAKASNFLTLQPSQHPRIPFQT